MHRKYRYTKHSRHDSYFIEFRFSGFIKKNIKDLVHVVARNFNVKNITDRKVLPHITIAGPLFTRNEKNLVNVITNVANNHHIVTFRLDGFGSFDKNVIYVKIKPSEELISMRNEIVDNLKDFCKLSEHDYKSKWTPHATLAMKDISYKFKEIEKFLKSWKIPTIMQQILRITILKNRKILNEYDLVQGKLLNRRESLNRNIFKKTINNAKLPNSDKRKPLELRGKVFFASDMHFDHFNIIRYCNRPFRNINEMNRSLVNNWNNIIGRRDTVYYLGDMAHGRGSRSIDYWLDNLNGKIRFIRGNHDKDVITKADVIHDHTLIKYNGYEFLLMHDPCRPANYNGWIIHGDKHNNDTEKYPFIHYGNKTINVCMEMINYKPIILDKIIDKIENI